MLERALRADIRRLGALHLLVGGSEEVPKKVKKVEEEEEDAAMWLEWAEQADPRMPLLLGLRDLLGNWKGFTAETAKFMTAGFLADKGAFKAYADGYDSGAQPRITRETVRSEKRLSPYSLDHLGSKRARLDVTSGAAHEPSADAHSVPTTTTTTDSLLMRVV